MAQLSIYDKLRHHSDKDFTCSVGKGDMIYLTFRHESWKLFTSQDYMSVYLGKTGGLKFGDPKDTKMLAPCFKLKKNNEGNEETRETTRYLKITGKKYPAILELVRRTAGSYDFPEPATTPNGTIIVSTKPQKTFKEVTDALDAIKGKPPTLRPYTKEEAEADAFAVRRNQFFADLKLLMDAAQSPEERTAILEALGKLYDMRPAKPKPIEIPTETQEQHDKWSI